MIPPLAAAYAARLGRASSAAVDATFTIEPPPAARRRGKVARQTRNVPVRCTASILFQSSSVELLERKELSEAGGVEDAVDPAELPLRRPYGLLDRVLVGDVAGQADRAVQLRRDGLGPLAIEIDDRHPPSLGGESPCGRRGEARGSAGGEEHPAVEPVLGRPSRPCRT